MPNLTRPMKKQQNLQKNIIKMRTIFAAWIVAADGICTAYAVDSSIVLFLLSFEKLNQRYVKKRV